METTNNMKVTSIEELKKSSQGALVELPPFAEGGEFIARLKRPSMLGLMKAGKIPNSLLTAANKMFKTGPSSFDPQNENMMTDLLKILDIVCTEALVEPTYAQLKEADIELTDDQLMFIFGYSQNGVKQLESFRMQ